jgi:hypothetical protein
MPKGEYHVGACNPRGPPFRAALTSISPYLFTLQLEGDSGEAEGGEADADQEDLVGGTETTNTQVSTLLRVGQGL